MSLPAPYTGPKRDFLATDQMAWYKKTLQLQSLGDNVVQLGREPPSHFCMITCKKLPLRVAEYVFLQPAVSKTAQILSLVPMPTGCLACPYDCVDVDWDPPYMIKADLPEPRGKIYQPSVAKRSGVCKRRLLLLFINCWARIAHARAAALFCWFIVARWSLGNAALATCSCTSCMEEWRKIIDQPLAQLM